MNYVGLLIVILFYLALFILLSISGKDKKKDARIVLNVLFPKESGQPQQRKISKTASLAKKLQNHQISLIREIKTEDYNAKEQEQAEPNSETRIKGQHKKSIDSNKFDEYSQPESECKINEEVLNKDNYKNIETAVISASHNKNFEINLNEVILLKSSVASNLKDEEKDLSKKENHNSFFIYNKFDDKKRLEDQEKQTREKLESFNKGIRKITNKSLSPNSRDKMRIRVSFMTEKKNILMNDEKTLEKSKTKRESKLRRLRNFSFKNAHILVIDEKYFLDSFFPLFSIQRYTSKSNPKMKRIMLLALTFQYYMLFSAIMFHSEVIRVVLNLIYIFLFFKAYDKKHSRHNDHHDNNFMGIKLLVWPVFPDAFQWNQNKFFQLHERTVFENFKFK